MPAPMLRFIADQVGVNPDRLAEYAARDETRREHLAELIAAFGWKTFGLAEHREVSAWLIALARGTDRGLALVRALLDELRRRRILAPALLRARPPGLGRATSCPPRGVSGADRRSQSRGSGSGWMSC